VWDWDKVIENKAEGIVTIQDQVGAASTFSEIYVKAFETDPEPDNVILISQATAVGKFDVNLVKPYTLISIPLEPMDPMPDSGVINKYSPLNVFGDQLNMKDQILKWMTAEEDPAFAQKYKGYTKAAAWPDEVVNFEVKPIKGYFIYLGANSLDTETLTLIGKVLKDDQAMSVNEKYTCLGYPYPIFKSDAAAAGFTVDKCETKDQILFWNTDPNLGSVQTFLGATYDKLTNVWSNPQFTEFSPGKGYFYFRKPGNGSFTWDISAP